MTPTDAPALMLAERIATAWNSCAIWHDSNEQPPYPFVIYTEDSVQLHTGAVSVWCFFHPSGPFIARANDAPDVDFALPSHIQSAHLLRIADKATEGMLTLGAENTGNDNLMNWLAYHASPNAGETACLDWLRGTT